MKSNSCAGFKFYIKQNLNASYTVETTLIMIIVILTLVYIVTMALMFYQMAAEYAATAENAFNSANGTADGMRLIRIIMRVGSE